MAVTAQRRKRISVTFPQPVLDLLDKVVPARERSAFIVEATEGALRRERLLTALRETSGAWSDEDHPDLMTADDVDCYVRGLRETWMPRGREDAVGAGESNR
jgi:hypothetical protein